MNKEVITDEMITKFVLDNTDATSLRDVVEKWEVFKNQPPQQEWEVVEFGVEHQENKWIKDVDGRFYKKGFSNFSLDELLENKHFYIYKIRRLSDNAVLEVGKEYEIIAATMSGNFKVRQFVVENDIVVGVHLDKLPFTEHFVHYTSLINLVSIKERSPVLFTTEDGKEIREGGVYWYIYNNNEVFSIMANRFSKTPRETTYSTKEVAEQHICDLSLSMIREALETSGWGRQQADGVMLALELGLSKLKTKE